nr:hypothetical protein [Tanacetum cinerariifolium]
MLKPSNYSFWAIRMQIILEANRLWETIEPNEKTQTDNRKYKTAIAFLYQPLPEDQLLQITKYKTAKAIWNALKTRHIGEERVQQARLQTLKSEFEMLHMKEDETIDAFTTRLTTLVNKASSLGHTMEDETLVLKLLNAVPYRLKTYEERIKYKGKHVDNQDRLLFTRYEEQGRRHGHGGSNQSQGQENNFKKETHNNSNKLNHNKSKEWKEIPFNLDLTDIKQQGVGSESLDGGITRKHESTWNQGRYTLQELQIRRSPACFELSWPMKKESPFLRWPKKTKRQGLTIVAFNDGKLNQDTFKSFLSIGPTYAILKFIEYCLDVLLMFGASSTTRGMVVSRLVIKFFWGGNFF